MDQDQAPTSPPKDEATTSTPKKVRQARSHGAYKGVRARAWGKWVSEIRVPKTGERIWLGSYDVPEKAARAYDAALYCLRGECGQFNFPDNRRPVIPEGSVDLLSKKDIQDIAANYALSDASVSSSVTTEESVPVFPDFLDSTELESACKMIDGSFEAASVMEAATTSESLELDDMFMWDVEEWLSDLF